MARITLAKIFQTEVLKAVKPFQKRLKKRVQDNVSGRILRRRTGQSRRAIFARSRRKTGGNVLVTVGARLNKFGFHLRWFERTGAKPHRIPRGGFFGRTLRTGRKTKGALKIGGRLIKKQVRHPGFRPRPFIEPAIDVETGKPMPEIEEALARSVFRTIPREIDFRF